MQLSEFDYALPPELIAQAPLAQRYFQRALTLLPTGDVRRMIAHEALEAIYRDTEDWGPLIELFLRQVEIFEDTAFKVLVSQKMANVYESKLGDAEGAFESLKYAFNIDYANEDTSRELERLATAANKWGELLNEYNGIVRTIEDKTEQSELWVKIGRWYADHLNRLDYAIASQQQALQIDKNHKEALTNLADCYRKTQQWPELVQVLEHHSNIEDDAPKKVELLLDLAALYENQLANAAQFRRMHALGAGVNLFANHHFYWGDQHRDVTVGPERAERMNACRSALDAGVPFAVHSDAPITPIGPLFTAWCAVNRRTASGRVLGQAQRIGVQQALHAVTLGAAWTLKLDGEIGSIECGKRADFCVLHDDPTTVAPDALKDVRVWGTVQGGRVFQA